VHSISIAITTYAVFLAFGHPWLKAQRENLPFGFKFLTGYAVCLAIGIFFRTLMAFHGSGFLYSHAAVVAGSPLLLLRIPLLLLACIPFPVWVKMLRATSPLWFFALLAGVAARFSIILSDRLWKEPITNASTFFETTTLHSVYWALHPFMPSLFVDAPSFTIGTPRFSLLLSAACSGTEGLGLVLAITSIWLWYFRKECRFPQVLLLVPCALSAIWALNVARLCALIVIGDSGRPDVAMVGFHPRAGWIAMTVVALAFSLATQKLSWARRVPSFPSSRASDPLRDGIKVVTTTPEEQGEQRGESPAIRAYLVPFLAILAATFVSKAASGNFEWLYPLRFVVALAAILYFWPELKKLNWRFGWFGPVAGIVIFLVWIAPTWWAHQYAASPIGPALAALSPTARWAWIAVRVTAAVVTVPIAEELAFRGYLARRFISRDFDSVSFTSLTALSVGISSLVFGLMHGEHWLVGTLAGLAYAAALRWRGRMGDAVIAHAVSNLLLAAWVLGLGDWAQW
jgi:exosortase E/protease (VPEID-CTERM system)